MRTDGQRRQKHDMSRKILNISTDTIYIDFLMFMYNIQFLKLCILINEERITKAIMIMINMYSLRDFMSLYKTLFRKNCCFLYLVDGHVIT